MVNGRVNFRKTGSLLSCRRCDRAHLFVDCSDEACDFRQAFAGIVDEYNALIDGCFGVADQSFDFLGSLGGPLGELANFLRHHGKALARLARAGSFHAGIECQKVGLERDFVNHANDLPNLIGRCFDAAHGINRV